MKLTELLNVEHGVFLGQLAHLEKLLAAEASPQILAVVVQTIGRAVAAHRDVEEKYLYPAIDAACGPNFPPLAIMEQEHVEIERGLDEAKSGSLSPGSARMFLEVLRQHISKEVHILFPTAEQAIPARDLEEAAVHATDFLHERAGVKIQPPCCHG